MFSNTIAIAGPIFLPKDVGASDSILVLMLGIIPVMFIFAGLIGTPINHAASFGHLSIKQRYIGALGGFAMCMGLLILIAVAANVNPFQLWYAAVEWTSGIAGFIGILMGVAAMLVLVSPILTILALIRIHFFKKRLMHYGA
jgi:hypothetical protein